MALSVAHDRPSPRALYRSQDLAAPARAAFDLLCEVEKWPVWLAFLRSSRLVDPAAPLALGSEVAVRAALPGEEEELFEVDRFVPPYHISLVGAYSVRRRIDFRVEQKSDRCKVVVRVDYPTYGGVLGLLVDRLTRRPRLERVLGDSLVHFKGLAEFDRSEAVLADF